MKLETKYSPGNVVFFMEDNKVHCGPITNIGIISFLVSDDLSETKNIVTNKVLLKYKKEKDASAGFLSEERWVEKYLTFSDDEIFPSKEDLLKSL